MIKLPLFVFWSLLLLTSFAAGDQSCEIPGSTFLLILDEEAIDKDEEPNYFTQGDLGNAKKGGRKHLPFFAAHPGLEIELPSGQVGDEGWFAPREIPKKWKKAGPSSDGLSNFFAGGKKFKSDKRIKEVKDLVPLRATGLSGLIGNKVCAVVPKNDASVNYGPIETTIDPETRGIAAFEVLGVTEKTNHSSSTLPWVTVRILDPTLTCGSMEPYADAPVPYSSSEPFDVTPPPGGVGSGGGGAGGDCPGTQQMLVEEWDSLDPTIWEADGDEEVSGSFYQVKAGAFSAFADWFPECPIAIESGQVVRFQNLVTMDTENPFGFTQSGFLSSVNADSDGSFINYMFINAGYTSSDGFLFVELFGENNGEFIGVFEITPIPAVAGQAFQIDLAISQNGYELSVDGTAYITVSTTGVIPQVSQFQVGLQQNFDGLAGRLDNTTVVRDCPPEAE